MTYESQNLVQSLDFTFAVIIRQDETSPRKLAVLAAC